MSSEAVISKIIFLPIKLLSSKKAFLTSISASVVKRSNVKKKKQVLTVGEINKETYLRKGLDRFIDLAKGMLDINFYHIGKWTDNKGNFDDTFFNYVKSISPKNIEYLGYLNDEELYNFFKESKVYAQLSRHEAFGVSVVEAISYNCIPVVWNSFSLPEVVCGNGFIVDNLLSLASSLGTSYFS